MHSYIHVAIQTHSNENIVLIYIGNTNVTFHERIWAANAYKKGRSGSQPWRKIFEIWSSVQLQIWVLTIYSLHTPIRYRLWASFGRKRGTTFELDLFYPLMLDLSLHGQPTIRGNFNEMVDLAVRKRKTITRERKLSGETCKLKTIGI